MKKGWDYKIAAIISATALTLLILLLKPFSMSGTQAAVLAVIIDVIVCWTLDLCGKVLSSAALIVILMALQSAPVDKLFTFPLSATFPMIVLCYLFSRGISNSGIAKTLIDPLLSRYARTPVKIILLMILMLTLTIQVIPQPLVRLIMLAEIFSGFLARTNVREETRKVLMFCLFEFYILVNAGALNADIILNTSTVSFSGVDMDGGAWLKYMMPPTVVYCVLTLALLCLMYRGELLGVKVDLLPEEREKTVAVRLSGSQIKLVVTVVVTILLWTTKSLHGISENVVTLVSVGVMFLIGILKPKDIDSIDVATLVFLTAANAIGSAVTYSGAAQQLLNGLEGAFPKQLSVRYVLMIIAVTMVLHFLLGSNTTALSVAIPGLAIVCGDTMPAGALMLTAYMSLIPHHLLPFHCIGMAIGVGNGYFDSKMIFKVGLPMMLMIVLVILVVYMPWWKLMGLL